jgi:hypothetical protein
VCLCSGGHTRIAYGAHKSGWGKGWRWWVVDTAVPQVWLGEGMLSRIYLHGICAKAARDSLAARAGTICGRRRLGGWVGVLDTAPPQGGYGEGMQACMASMVCLHGICGKLVCCPLSLLHVCFGYSGGSPLLCSTLLKVFGRAASCTKRFS